MLSRFAHDGVEVGQIENRERSELEQVVDHLDGVRAARQHGADWLVASALATLGARHLSLPNVQRGDDAIHEAMRIFIFEYVCGGGFQGDSPPPELLRQGHEMLRAALVDFSSLDSVQVYTLIEERFSFDLPEKVRCQTLRGPWRDAWLDLARHCDAVLVIAPESEGWLGRLREEVSREGRLSLNGSLEAIRLASDKWALNRHLRAAGIEAVETRAWDPSETLPMSGVIKPRHGAGCEDTFALGAESLAPTLDSERSWVWQPWVEGEAVSLSLWVGKEGVDVLSCNRIHCENREGKLHAHRMEVGGLDGDSRFREAARAMSLQIMAAVPGLRGYVGVDGVWLGSSLTVLEINPRLTLAYARRSMSLAERTIREFGWTEDLA